MCIFLYILRLGATLRVVILFCLWILWVVGLVLYLKSIVERGGGSPLVLRLKTQVISEQKDTTIFRYALCMSHEKKSKTTKTLNIYYSVRYDRRRRTKTVSCNIKILNTYNCTHENRIS